MRRLFLITMVFFLGVTLSAHIPGFLEKADFASGSYFVEDIDLSQIFYYEFGENETIVFTFGGVPGKELHMLFGVPVGVPEMETTYDYRPTLTLYNPDGSVRDKFDFSQTEPEVMYEFFGDTNSYLYLRYDRLMENDGTYRLLISSKESGRAWITFGRRESFTFGQILMIPNWIRQIRSFHYMSGLARWEKYGLAGLGVIVAVTALLIIF